jgi:hypothetical protein
MRQATANQLARTINIIRLAGMSRRQILADTQVTAEPNVVGIGPEALS